MDLLELPYSSRRSPVLAERGAVATSQPLAAQAGLAMLRQGGNAVDAALATAAALTVVEPTSNGIGGDAFALVWDGRTLHGLNGSGRAPQALDAGVVRGQGLESVPEVGWLSVTVPGQPAAWEALHRRFGRLDFAECLAPAIGYAEDGFPVSVVISGLWRRAATKYLPLSGPEYVGWRETFTRDGRVPQAGDRWSSPGHARTLRLLAARGAAAFYSGELADELVAFSRASGGFLGAEDLAAHRGQWVDPISTRYGAYTVWEMPPNGQGLAALMSLAMLDGLELARYPHGSEVAWHLQVEAMKLAFADAHRYIADPEHAEVPSASLLAADYITERRALIGETAADPGPGVPAAGGTVYLCTTDRDGMMVSYIQSNYHGFGSGVVVPGTGIALHNRGTAFSLEPGHRNELAPGKRPFHTIIPGFLSRGGEPVGPFGVMGAPMQPQGHVQVISGTVDHGMNPQAVLDAPRWRVLAGRDLVVEPATPEAVTRGLAARGHRLVPVTPEVHFGRGQIIWRLDSGVYVAGSEPRADGCVAAW